jgi:hypothetical protein
MERRVVSWALRRILFVVGCAALVFAFIGCPAFIPTPWPTNYAPILTDQFVDPGGDEMAPAGVYPSIDVTDLALGISDDYLYIRVDFSAPIPTTPQDVSGVWPSPSESVKDHGFNFILNVDGQPGFDISFICKLRYGEGYILYAFRIGVSPDLEPLVAVGELGEGGSGFNYLIARYDVSNLGSLFPRGAAVSASFDASATAVDYDENTADAATDMVAVGIWTIPN